jgi:hypothetical protein
MQNGGMLPSPFAQVSKVNQCPLHPSFCRSDAIATCTQLVDSAGGGMNGYGSLEKYIRMATSLPRLWGLGV